LLVARAAAASPAAGGFANPGSGVVKVPAREAQAASPPAPTVAAAAAGPLATATATRGVAALQLGVCPGMLLQAGRAAEPVAPAAVAAPTSAAAGLSGSPTGDWGPAVSSSSRPRSVVSKVPTAAATPPANIGGGVHQGAAPAVEDAEQGMCVVCLAARSCVLMWPCRHLCCCGACSQLLQARAAACPMCRRDVREHLEVYV
jgi:hypothetical protein